MKPILLEPNELQALQAFIQKLDQMYPYQRPQVMLYGSKARGDSTTDSDIDVLVIVRQEDRIARQKILALAARVSLEQDVLLNPFVIGEIRFSQRRDFTFYRNVMTDAVQLVLQAGSLKMVSSASLLVG